MRTLIPVFGLSFEATSVVLCAFMGGLGLGSLLAPGVLRRTRRSPWTLLAATELAIACCGLAFLELAPALQVLYLWADSSAPESARFALAVLTLALPTTLMGLTLPLFLAALPWGKDGRSLGLVYAANTLGGVTGVLVAGFYALESAGTRGTTALAVALQVFIAAGCWMQRRQDCSDDLGRQETGELVAPPRLLMGVMISGFVALSLELVWFRLLLFHLQAATYSVTVMLAVFLLGLGLGSAVFSAFLSSRLGECWTWAVRLQVAVSLAIVLSIPLPAYLPALWTWLIHAFGAESWGIILLQKILVASVLMLPATCLMGVTFPLLAYLVEQPRGRSAFTHSRVLAKLYTLNTLGSVGGILVTAFFLFPTVGSVGTLVLLAGLSLLGAGLLSAGHSKKLCLGAATLGILLPFLTNTQSLTRDLYQSLMGSESPIIFFRESSSDITFVTEPSPGLRALYFHDARGASATASAVVKLNRLLAYSAMALHPEAKNVLVISMGCGNTAAGFIAFPIESLDIVDISPGPFEAAQYFPTNRQVLQDPRVRTHVEDGRNFLLRSQEQYDIIQLELPSVSADGVAFLYTREFYQLARSRLKDNGILSQWIHAQQSQERLSKTLARTLVSEFPNSILWTSWGSWWLTATPQKGPLSVELPVVSALFEREQVRDDLNFSSLSLTSVLGCLTASGDELETAIGDGPVITDARTIVDFETPRVPSFSALGGGLGNIGRPTSAALHKRWQERIRWGKIVYSTPLFYSTFDSYRAPLQRSVARSVQGLTSSQLERLIDYHLARDSLKFGRQSDVNLEGE